MTERIVKWNEYRGFLEDFDMKREVSYTLSEDLEMLGWKALRAILSVGFAEYGRKDLANSVMRAETHDDLARWIVGNFWREENTKAEFLDKCADQRVFIDGGMAKVIHGHSGEVSDEIDKVMDFVMTANELKPIGKTNEHGKQEKGDGFEKVDPKHKIQGLLDGLGIEG